MKTMTLFGLLDDYSILIPHLQRNYVHGRDDAHAKEVREHFMKSLDECCINGTEMNLDVIYGIRDKERNVLIPIDGQQRLMTLWLSAVYATSTSKDNASRLDLLSKLSRFSYESRPLAATFCRWLTSGAEVNYDIALLQAEDCWGEDPTVHSMITTLRLIHDTFKNRTDVLLEALHGDKIHFEFSEVHGKDSDLYVKINARGKQLTQWENFKGAFASQLTDKNVRKAFEREIEKYSDKYFDVREETPDQAFFALFARLADYVLRTSMTADQPFKDEQHNNLSVLAESKVAVNQTYVPIEEFGLDDGVAEKIALPVLRIIHWSLENDAPFTYWDETKKIVDAVFFPQNANEKDFSLFLYEYFSKYDDGEALKSNDFRALRLVANILENVARQPRDITSTKQFNRIEILRQFLQESAGLYASNVALHRNAPLQCVEEKVKAALYETIDSPDIVKLIPMLHACEKTLHGRVRIAILNLSNKDSEESIPDIKNNLECLRQRLTKVQMLCKEWTTGNDDQRAELFFDKIVPAFDWDIPNDVRLVFKDDKADHGLRGIICTENDACLQRTLIDGEVSKGVEGADYDIDGVRDWRDILCKKDLRQIFSVDGIKIKWHYASGRYYLYTGENQVRWAYPISDYRIDVLFDDEFEKVLRQISLNSSEEERKELIRLNDGSTVSFCMKNGLICYFGRNDITVRAYGEKGSHLQNVSWSYKEFHGTISSFLLGISEMTFDDFVANGKNALRFSK